MDKASQSGTRYTLDRVVRMVLSAAALVAVLALLRYLSDVLLPFAAAAVLAYLLNPLVTMFEDKIKHRSLAVAITLGGLSLIGLAVVVILTPLIIGQISRFQNDLHKLRDDLTRSMDVVPDPSGAASPGQKDDLQQAKGRTSPPQSDLSAQGGKSAIGWHELKEGWLQYRQDSGALPRSQRLARFRDHLSGTYIGVVVDKTLAYTRSEEFNNLLVDVTKRLAIGGWTVVTVLVNILLGLVGLVVVLLYLVFLLMDYPTYAQRWPLFLPPTYREPIVEFLEQFNLALRRYLRGQSVIALLVGALFSLGFWLIGLPMAVPFGLFVGLLNMVPYLQTVAIVPATLLAGLRALEGDVSFLGSVALTLLIFAVVQVIQDALITPRVLGQATGLRPVAILLGVFIWGKLLGFLGLLLAIPLTCLGIAYYRRYVLLHDEKKESGHLAAASVAGREK